MLKSVSDQVKSSSTQLIFLGILAIIVGCLALAWPGVTTLALVILFAIWAFTYAVLQFMRMVGSATAGPVVGHLLLALIDIAAGIVALAWPAPTALVLVLVVGIWALVRRRRRKRDDGDNHPSRAPSRGNNERFDTPGRTAAALPSTAAAG